MPDPHPPPPRICLVYHNITLVQELAEKSLNFSANAYCSFQEVREVLL